MLHGDVTDSILKAFYKVYNTLGYGFLEKVYENAMRIELTKMNVPVKQKKYKSVFDKKKKIRQNQFNPLNPCSIFTCITVEDAIKCYTLNAAYAGFQENITGSIEVGKLADLVVLTDDILTIDPVKIKDVEVELTVFDGSIIYVRDKQNTDRADSTDQSGYLFKNNWR